MSDKKKPSKIAGAGAAIRNLVGGSAKPAPTVKSKGPVAKPKDAVVNGFTMPAKTKKEMATELVKYAKEDKAKGPKASKEQIAAMEAELDLMSLPPQACPTTVTRRFEFDAAHRVLGHRGKCRHLHGHRYVVEVTVSGPELDGLGMVVDFAVLKEKVGKFLDDVYDHNIILHKDDPLLALRHSTSTIKVVSRGKSDRQPTVTIVEPDDVFTRQPVVLPFNPTAENMAKVIYDQATELLAEDSLAVVCVRVYETPNCWADYCPPEGGGGGGGDQPGDEDGEGEPSSGGDDDGDEEGGGEEDGEDDNGGGDDDDGDEEGDEDEEDGDEEGVGGDEDEDEDEEGVGGDEDEDEDEEGDAKEEPTVTGPAKSDTPAVQPPKKVRRERI